MQNIFPKIIHTLLLISSIAFVYFLINGAYFKSEIISNSIGVTASAVIILNLISIKLVNNRSNGIIIASSILSGAIILTTISCYLSPTRIPQNWNYILGMLVLTIGIALISKISTKSRLTKGFIGVTVLYLNSLIILEIDSQIIYATGFILLGSTTLLSLLQVFRRDH